MAGKSSGRGRGFNAARKGSGQVGFQPAPPVHPEVPSAADDYILAFPEENNSDGIDDYLDEMYNKFKNTDPVKELKYSPDDSEGLSLREQGAVLAARGRLASSPVELSNDSTKVALAMFKAWGLTDQQYEEAVDKAQEKFESNYDYYDYLDGNEAASSVRSLIEEPPFYGEVDSDMEASFITQISKGKILISNSDMEQLRKVRDEAYSIHARDTSPDRTQPLDAEWISASVNRKCELCGQFISTRNSHGSFSSSTSHALGIYGYLYRGQECPSSACPGDHKLVSEVENNFIKASRSFSPKETFLGYARWGESSKIYTFEKLAPLEGEEVITDISTYKYADEHFNVPELDKRKLSDYPPELLEDIYMTGANSIRDHIIAFYAEKKGFKGKKTKFIVPQNIREAIVEAPPFSKDFSLPRVGLATKPENTLEPLNQTMVVLASRIEPPFSDGEIKRMIMTGDAGVVNALLSARRTHGVAAEIVANYPSEGARILALRENKLSPEVLSNMASSGSPEIRALAASSPHLSDDDAVRLAEDPDPEVRKALIFPESGSSENNEPRKKKRDLSISGIKMEEPYGPLDSGEWSKGAYAGDSYLRRNVDKIGHILINDPDPEVAKLAFSSLRAKIEYDNYLGYKGRVLGESSENMGLSSKQKYLISKIKSRTRFNELKKFVLSHDNVYNTSNPEVAKFLAY